jgi:uncharacterized protein YndB with AHSA1/START domain
MAVRIARAAPCAEPAAKDIKQGSGHLKTETRAVMAGIEAEVVIDGPQEKVFDVVTTAGLWPQWAVLARAVAGVTERPFQLGDPIYEFVRTPIGPQEVLWRITEHDRPHHAKLQAEDGTTITYTFIGKGDATSFRRAFELGSVLGAQQPPPYTGDTAGAENANLKALVAKILWREQKARNLP